MKKNFFFLAALLATLGTFQSAQAAAQDDLKEVLAEERAATISDEVQAAEVEAVIDGEAAYKKSLVKSIMKIKKD